MLKIAVVENETEPAEKLVAFAKEFAQKSNEECKVLVYHSGVDFLEEYRADFDAVFLDIVMPMMDGMTVAEKLRESDKNVTIIFVTNMAQFAIRGYKVGALDFLVKPVNYFDFSLEMQKICNIKKQRENLALFVSCNGTTRRVIQSDISYIEVLNHNVVIHEGKEKITFRGSLKEFERKLDKRLFSRCNNCYIVNLSRVFELSENEVKLDGGEKIPVSRPRKQQFMHDLTAYISDAVRGRGGER